MQGTSRATIIWLTWSYTAVLHLCGYDHETAAEAQVMEATEVAILSGLGSTTRTDPSYE